METTLARSAIFEAHAFFCQLFNDNNINYTNGVDEDLLLLLTLRV